MEKLTYDKADAAEYYNGLSVLEQFSVSLVLDQADREDDGAGQQEEHAEVEEGDPAIETFISIPVSQFLKLSISALCPPWAYFLSLEPVGEAASQTSCSWLSSEWNIKMTG